MNTMKVNETHIHAVYEKTHIHAVCEKVALHYFKFAAVNFNFTYRPTRQDMSQSGINVIP